MKAKRNQILIKVESRLDDTFTAPGGTVFYRYNNELFDTHNTSQVGTVAAVGADIDQIKVGDRVFFRWTVTHDRETHILHGDIDLWPANCIVRHGIPDVFAVINDDVIKPVYGFAFVEPLEEEVGFGDYKTTKRSEKWGYVRYVQDGYGVSAGDKVFFGTQHDDDADLNTVLGKAYYIMEASRIQLKLEEDAV